MLERQRRPAQGFIENAPRHPQHQSREAGSCMGANRSLERTFACARPRSGFRPRRCENPGNWYPIRCRAGRIGLRHRLTRPGDCRGGEKCVHLTPSHDCPLPTARPSASGDAPSTSRPAQAVRAAWRRPKSGGNRSLPQTPGRKPPLTARSRLLSSYGHLDPTSALERRRVALERPSWAQSRRTARHLARSAIGHVRGPILVNSELPLRPPRMAGPRATMLVMGSSGSRARR